VDVHRVTNDPALLVGAYASEPLRHAPALEEPFVNPVTLVCRVEDEHRERLHVGRAQGEVNFIKRLFVLALLGLIQDEDGEVLQGLEAGRLVA